MLTPKEVFEDRRLLPKPVTDTVTSEEEMCAELVTRKNLVGFSQISAWDTPRIEIGGFRFGDSFSLIVGDSYNDHLLFWNSRSFYRPWLNRDLVSLLVSNEDLDRTHIYDCVLGLLRTRNHVRNGGSQETVCIRSASIATEELQILHARIQEDKVWLGAQPTTHANPDEIAPTSKELVEGI